MATATRLTQNDSAVLSQLFDPESAPTSSLQVDASLPEDPSIHDIRVLASIKNAEKAIIQSVETAMQNPSPSSKANAISVALEDISSLLELHPTSASLHNDFAQIARLQHGDTLLVSSTPALATLADRVLSSLNTAIKLLSPTTPQSAISPAQGRTLAQSHMQRGALYREAYKQMDKDKDTQVAAESLRDWGSAEFEEAASKDFWYGGRYGNEIGKALAVHTNPTAKLCGEVVKDAMRREFAGTQTT